MSLAPRAGLRVGIHLSPPKSQRAFSPLQLNDPGRGAHRGIALTIQGIPTSWPRRLLRYADIVGRDSVMAGTDCGFSQSPLAGRVHRSIMWAKLKCLAEGAAIASKVL